LGRPGDPAGGQSPLVRAIGRRRDRRGDGWVCRRGEDRREHYRNAGRTSFANKRSCLR
jgi:hypothetical protein